MTVQAMGLGNKAGPRLLRSDEPRGRQGRDPDRRTGPGEDSDGDPLMCRRCGQQITATTQRISVSGSHEHTFANPEGVLFHIGCFGNVQGCYFSGEPTDQWSWFKGYKWCVTYCCECNLHLGWSFTSGEHVFHGLVLQNLSRLS